MPDMALEPARRIPVVARPDVLVAGGGSAGIAAATAAARAGCSVVLVERYGFLGGTLTAVTLGGFCGGWTTCGDEVIDVVGGLFGELVDRLRRIDGAGSTRRWGRVVSLPYDPTAVKVVADEMLGDRVGLMLHTWIADVQVENERIHTVLVENKAGRRAICPKILIDCTGDADVVARAGGGFELGHDGITQFGSSMFRVANVDMAAFGALSRDQIAARLEALAHDGVALPRTAVALYPNPIDGVVHFNATRLARPDGSPFNLVDPDDLTAAEQLGRKQALHYVEVARRYLPGFERARLIDIGANVGIRETRLVHGRAVLDVEHVLAGRKPPDTIACTAWPVEIHAQGQQTVWRHLAEGDFYGVPYGCLLPASLDNVLIAGRCISATHEAQASIRVSAPAFALGEAAGLAAWLALQKGNRPADISVPQLQTRLRDNGAFPGAVSAAVAPAPS